MRCYQVLRRPWEVTGKDVENDKKFYNNEFMHVAVYLSSTSGIIESGMKNEKKKKNQLRTIRGTVGPAL